VLRLVGAAAADVVDGDAAVVRRELFDEVPPGEAPGRVAMYEQQHLAGALVDVVVAQAVNVEEAVGEGVLAGKVVEGGSAGCHLMFETLVRWRFAVCSRELAMSACVGAVVSGVDGALVPLTLTCSLRSQVCPSPSGGEGPWMRCPSTNLQ